MKLDGSDISLDMMAEREIHIPAENWTPVIGLIANNFTDRVNREWNFMYEQCDQYPGKQVTKKFCIKTVQMRNAQKLNNIIAKFWTF